MAVELTINGVTYNYPELTDEAWGPDATNWAVAITQGVLTKAGGLFSLTSDADFGPNFGLKSAYYKTRSTNIATTGQFRLSNSDVISFRNAGNTANLDFGTGSSDAIPEWNGIDLVNLSTAQSISNKTFTASTFTGGTFNSPTINTPTVTGGTFSTPSVSGGTFTNPTVTAGTFSTPSLGNPSITGVALFADGTAALPSISFTNASTTGYYLFGANSLGISTNGISAGNVDSNQRWSIGASGSSQSHVINGNSLTLFKSAAEFAITANTDNDGSLALTGSGSSANGGVVLVYGNLHATLANVTKFKNASVETGEINASGKWTIGSSGSSQVHTINGDFSQVSPSASNIQEALKSITLTDNTTNGVAISNAAASSTNWIVDYSITRSTDRETGTLVIVSDGSTAQVVVQSVNIGSPGVSFTADVSGANVRLLYTTTSTGSNATMKYSTKSWNS